MSKDPICFCFEVYEETLVEIIKKHNASSVEEVQKYCKAGMGCGGCKSEIENIIARELNQK